MSNSDINASNQAQLAAQEAAKNTNDLNAKQAGLLVAAQDSLAQSTQELAQVPAQLAVQIQNARNNPDVWNKFTPEEQASLIQGQADFEKQAADLKASANQVAASAAQSKAELSQMTFNGEKLDTNIKLTEQSLKDNLDVPANYTAAKASTIDDPAGDVNNLIPPPVGQITPPTATDSAPPAYIADDAVFAPPPSGPVLLTDEQINALYPPIDPKETGATFGTMIISDEARKAYSDPASIAEQLALTEFAANNPPPTITTKSVPLSDEEAAALFAQAEAEANTTGTASNVNSSEDANLPQDDPFIGLSGNALTSAPTDVQKAQEQLNLGKSVTAQAQENILQSQENIAIAETNIATATQNIAEINGRISSLQQENEVYTAQLLDPNLTGADRVRIEANLAANAKIIAAEQAQLIPQQQSIQENTASIQKNRDSIQTNEAIITNNDEANAVNQAIVSDYENSLTAAAGPAPVGEEDPFEAARLAAEAAADEEPADISLDVDPLSDEAILALEQQQEENRATLRAQEAPNPYVNGVPYDDEGNLNPGWTLDEEGNPVYVGGDFVEPATQESAAQSRNAAASSQSGFKGKAQSQQTLMTRQATPAAADWRVRLSLAKGSNYLYNAGNNGSEAGILQPLWATNGVVFPYTPSIETSYSAKYDPYDLVHSNYRGYFYRNSSVGEIQVKGTFTAQDTKEAAYLLAVIHFFRSVTKMFYGQDAQAGTPPPLVYLSGFGQYQFSNHSCVVSNFGYSLPTDVDYIRADGFNNYGINLENRRNLSSGPGLTGTLGTVSRLINNLLPNGSLPSTPTPSQVNKNVNNTTATNSTYVPTKMDVSITLLPIQSRSQVSKDFSVRDFASGKLITKGFW